MNIWGWLIMGVSIGTVTSLFIWCLNKVLCTPNETEHVHGFEQTPPDAKN